MLPFHSYFFTYDLKEKNVSNDSCSYQSLHVLFCTSFLFSSLKIKMLFFFSSFSSSLVSLVELFCFLSLVYFSFFFIFSQSLNLSFFVTSSLMFFSSLLLSFLSLLKFINFSLIYDTKWKILDWFHSYHFLQPLFCNLFLFPSLNMQLMFLFLLHFFLFFLCSAFPSLLFMLFYPNSNLCP